MTEPFDWDEYLHSESERIAEYRRYADEYIAKIEEREKAIDRWYATGLIVLFLGFFVLAFGVFQ